MSAQATPNCRSERLDALRSPPGPGQSARVSDLRLVARARVARLTDEETVALGRELIGLSASAHVSYPDGTPTVVVLVHNLSGNLQELARRHVTDVLGDFDETVE